VSPASVSVVIPAFNTARFLGETLQSLRNQSLQDWECVVVDDGSSDGTLDVVLEHAAADPRVRGVRTENRGPSAARNHGYVLTSPESDFVTFMDSDDVWLPHALATLSSRLRGDPAAIGAHGLAEMMDESGTAMPAWGHSTYGRSRLGLEGNRLIPWPLNRPTSFEVLINGNVLNPPGLLLARRSGYERVGRFDEQVGENVNGAEDWDMLIRLSRHGYLSFVNDVLLYYRRHDSNLGAAPGIERRAWRVRCKAFHSPENSREQQRIARLGWKAYQRRMIRERFDSGMHSVRTRNVWPGLKAFAQIPAHALRYARGYPTPRVIQSSEPWGTSIHA
jgi:glycosyltransferase involved in cell wall biosynthesis